MNEADYKYFCDWRLAHYEQRLKQAVRIEERAWLRNELYNLKKSKNL